MKYVFVGGASVSHLFCRLDLLFRLILMVANLVFHCDVRRLDGSFRMIVIKRPISVIIDTI